MILRNHYETLGINKGATDADVRRAYHRLAKLYHPDKNDDPKAEEKFKEIGQAYEVMKCKDRREIWEREFARQSQTLREQRINRQNETSKTETRNNKNATTTKRPKTPKKEAREDPRKTTPKSTPTRAPKYSFFFTDSDYENDNDENEKIRKRRSRRSQSYAGPDTDSNAKWNSPKERADKENFKNNNPYGFNIFMDSDEGFQTFFDPFHMFYEWQDTDTAFQFRDFAEDAEEVIANFRADIKAKKSKAKNFAASDGEKDWYDWTRVFQPIDSDDDSYDPGKLMCSYCRKQMSADLLRKHESRCRRFSCGPDIMALRQKQALLETDRRRRSSLQQETMTNVPRDELITCMYCYRKFNQKVAERHIDFCARQTYETGRPMNPLGKSAAARDYCSKNYTAKEYAKTVPKPKTVPRADSASSVRATSPDPTKTKPVRKRSGKPKLIDVGIPPNNAKFNSPSSTDTGSGPGSVPGDGCTTCQRQYGLQTSRFTCSCGVKKSFSS